MKSFFFFYFLPIKKYRPFHSFSQKPSRAHARAPRTYGTVVGRRATGWRCATVAPLARGKEKKKKNSAVVLQYNLTLPSFKPRNSMAFLALSTAITVWNQAMVQIVVLMESSWRRNTTRMRKEDQKQSSEMERWILQPLLYFAHMLALQDKRRKEASIYFSFSFFRQIISFFFFNLRTEPRNGNKQTEQ